MISDAETEAVLRASDSTFLRPFVKLLNHTACRRSDLCRLRWERVDLESDAPTLFFKTTKNGDPRSIPLSPEAVRILEALPGPRVGPVFKSPRWPGPSVGDDGSDAPPLRADSVTQAWIRARERAADTNPSLADARLHDHRHTGTTRLYYETDLREMEIAQITGHRDLRSLKRYSHLNNGRRLSKALGWDKESTAAKEAAPKPEAAAGSIRVRKEGAKFVAFADTPDGRLEAEGGTVAEAKSLLKELMA